ncbi:MAG: hypothetical protein RSC91_03370, partial [Clostridia bacterium]
RPCAWRLGAQKGGWKTIGGMDENDNLLAISPAFCYAKRKRADVRKEELCGCKSIWHPAG